MTGSGPCVVSGRRQGASSKQSVGSSVQQAASSKQPKASGTHADMSTTASIAYGYSLHHLQLLPGAPAEDVSAAVGVAAPEAAPQLLSPRPLGGVVAPATEHQPVVASLAERTTGAEDVPVIVCNRDCNRR